MPASHATVLKECKPKRSSGGIVDFFGCTLPALYINFRVRSLDAWAGTYSFDTHRERLVKKTLITFVALLWNCPVPANAAKVYLQMTYPTATTWQVVAASSPGDNGGIFSVGFTMTGALTNVFRGPIQSFWDGSDLSTLQQYGFTTKLGPTSGINGGTAVVSIGQGLSDPAGDYFYNVRRIDGTGAGSNLTVPSGLITFGSVASFSYPVLLFNGTRAAGGVVDLVQGTGNATVFKVAGQGAGLNLTPATIASGFEPLPPPSPEPASFTLMAFAGLGLAILASQRVRGKTRQSVLACTQGASVKWDQTKHS